QEVRALFERQRAVGVEGLRGQRAGAFDVAARGQAEGRFQVGAGGRVEAARLAASAAQALLADDHFTENRHDHSTPFFLSRSSSIASSSAVRSVSGGRTGPAPWPTRRAPALT